MSRKWHVVMQLMAALDPTPRAATLAALVMKSDDNWLVPISEFPIKQMGPGERRLHHGDENILAAELDGLLVRADEGVLLSQQRIWEFLHGFRTVGANSSTSNNSSKKKSTSTKPFSMMSGHPSGLQIAFIEEVPELARASIVVLVEGLGHGLAQQVVHELGAVYKAGRVKGSLASYAYGIARKAREGRFVLAAGLEIAQAYEDFKRGADAEPGIIGGNVLPWRSPK